MGVQANAHCLSPSISSNGRFVAFESRADNLVDSDDNGHNDVFVHDRLASELCGCDFDRDFDVDGVDLAIQANGGTKVILSIFADYFG
jgi:hypothetical protein